MHITRLARLHIIKVYFKSTYLRQAAPGRFSRKFLEKAAAGGQGTAYVNNLQAVLAAAESQCH